MKNTTSGTDGCIIFQDKKHIKERLEKIENILCDTKLQLNKALVEIQDIKYDLKEAKEDFAKTASDLSDTKCQLTNTINDMQFYKNLIITNHINLQFRGKIFLHPKSSDENKGDFTKC